MWKIKQKQKKLSKCVCIKNHLKKKICNSKTKFVNKKNNNFKLLYIHF